MPTTDRTPTGTARAWLHASLTDVQDLRSEAVSVQDVMGGQDLTTLQALLDDVADEVRRLITVTS